MVVEIIEPFWFSTDWLCYPANAEFFIQLFENLQAYLSCAARRGRALCIPKLS